MSALKASLAASGPASAAGGKERKPAKTADKESAEKERKVSGD